MLVEAEYVFKQHIDNRGFYGNIVLDVEVIEGDDFELNYDPKSPWFAAVLFGVSYFYEDMFRSKRVRLKVNIKSIHWQAVDSSNMVILYVCLMALYKSLNIETKNIFIDEFGILHLPKFTGNKLNIYLNI